jgi:hypothetical protein
VLCSSCAGPSGKVLAVCSIIAMLLVTCI